MLKECSQCKQTKDISLFPKRSDTKGGYAAHCKVCHRSYSTPEAKAARRKQLRLPKKIVECVACGTVFQSIGDRDWCTGRCKHRLHYLKYIERWKRGEEAGVSAQGSIVKYVRWYLFEKYNNQCMLCGWAEINPVTGKTPLEVDHIDGDWRNSVEDNLRLLCPNCHSLTPNYRALNRRPAERTKQKVSRKQF